MLTAQTAPTKNNAARWTLFAVISFASTAILAWLLYKFPTGFDSPAGPISLLILLACTLALLWAIRNPIPADFDAAPTQKGRLALLIFIVSIPLFILPMLTKIGTLAALPLLSLVVVIWQRAVITRRELLYAAVLALICAVAGLGTGNITYLSNLFWAGLQLPLVFLGLLAGWRTFKSTGLLGRSGGEEPAAGPNNFRIGYSQFIGGGWLPALRAFGLGMLIAVPWALGNIMLGGSHDPWIDAWWKPLTAILPGVAEEAWGRFMMVSFLFLVFRTAARPRIAFATALILAAYWFSYLHTPMGLNGITSTLLLGTLYGLSTSYLTLYCDLETGIGYHFFIDFVRYTFALLI